MNPDRHPIAGSPLDAIHRSMFVGGDAHARVSAVVVTYNSAQDIPRLIDDLRVAAQVHPTRLIVVDNDSSDATADVVRAHEDVVLVEAGGNFGYAGGINVALQHIGLCDAVLILNPDLRLAPDAVTQLLAAMSDDRIGAVVPLMLDEDGTTYFSLRREPTLIRAVGDALLGSKLGRRPGFLSEIDCRPDSYAAAHDVDWATGAALLVPSPLARLLGDWNEEYFLYSEETDYFRRVRESGRRVRFEPSAVVRHRRGGSGASPALSTLMAVNRIRYAERHHGRVYSTGYRAVVALAAGLRSYARVHRHTLAVVLNRRRWRELPRASKVFTAE
jgi:GT2 family glycosyltransferase